MAKREVASDGKTTERARAKPRPAPPAARCCVCGTRKNLYKDGWYGYRCHKDSCIPY